MRIFVDIDGVVADFNSSFAKFDNDIKKLFETGHEGVEDFFAGLDVLDDGLIVLRWLIDNGHNFTFLSAPLNGDMVAPSIYGKNEWLRKNISGILGGRYSAIYSTQKYKYCNRGDILIDDLEHNIIPWREHGGIGILYTGASDALRDLEFHLK